MNTQDTLINTLVSQVGPYVHPMNHVVEVTIVVTLDPWVSPYINNDIGEAQTNHQCTFILEIPTRLAQHGIDSNHTPIPTLSNTSIIPSWVKLVTVVASMNHLHPPIWNSFTWQINWGKRPSVQTTMVFIRKQDYDWSHIDESIVDTYGQQNKLWQKF